MTERTGLAKEFDYYLAHQDELVEQYDGKVIVIKDGEVLGAYGSLIEAVTETEKAGHELGTFLVQSVSPGPDAYTHTHHSRVLRAFGFPNSVVIQNVPVSRSGFTAGGVRNDG